MLQGIERQLLVIPRHDPAFRNYVQVHSITEATLLTAQRTFRLLWILDPADKLRFEGLCRLVYERSNLTFAVDELQAYCPNRFASIGKYFQQLCLHGRHANIAVVGISQRPANMHKDFLSQAATIHVFKLIWQGDFKALKELPGVERCKTFKVGEHLTFP